MAETGFALIVVGFFVVWALIMVYLLSVNVILAWLFVALTLITSGFVCIHCDEYY